MTMHRNAVQITSFILYLSSFAYAQVISSQPSTNWGSRIAGIVVGSLVLLAFIALCFASRRRQWRVAPTFIRRADKPQSTLPYWQGAHAYGPPPGPPFGQPSGHSYGYNAQPAPAPPPYTKESEGATAPHYSPPPGPPPPAHTRETNHF